MIEIPKPRYSITITINANELEDVFRVFRSIEQCDLLEGEESLERDRSVASSVGYSFVSKFNPEMTKEKWIPAIMAYREAKREAQK